MSEEDRDFTTIWITHATSRRLLQIKYALMKKDGKARNPDNVISELIEFWNEN